jgi:Flp pilus assembly protein TadG
MFIRSKQRTLAHSGMATVELAICLPVLVLIVFGSIQATNLIYLQHAATSAAYEGMLELAKPNATNESVEARIQQVLDAREVTKSQISLYPDGINVSQTPAGNALTIEVTADVRANLALWGFIIAPDTIRASVAGTR